MIEKGTIETSPGNLWSSSDTRTGDAAGIPDLIVLDSINSLMMMASQYDVLQSICFARAATASISFSNGNVASGSSRGSDGAVDPIV